MVTFISLTFLQKKTLKHSILGMYTSFCQVYYKIESTSPFQTRMLVFITNLSVFWPNSIPALCNQYDLAV